MNRRLFYALIAAVSLAAFARPATLNLSLADANDPHPRRVEIGAEMLGVGLALVLSWTQHSPVTR